MRYAFVARHRTRYPTRVLCRVLGVSVSGFHDYLHRQSARTDDADAVLRTELRAIHAASNRSYGRHRLVRALRARNHAVGHKRVARLMAEERIQGKIKGRSRRKTPAAGSAQLAPNLLDRQFTPGTGPSAWVGDITYVATRQGWLHLAVVISIQTRQVLAYSVSERMTEDVVLKAFANPHVHLMCSDRIPDGIERTPDRTFSPYNPIHPTEGGCRKDSGGKSPMELRQEVTARRKLVADTQNEMLAECGHSIRVDHRSLRDQGLGRRAERHLGPLLIKEMADGEKAQYVSYRAGHDDSTSPYQLRRTLSER